MPLPLLALMSAAGPMMEGIGSIMEGMKGAPPPSGAGMAEGGDNTGFGENTSLAALKAGGANRPQGAPPPPQNTPATDPAMAGANTGFKTGVAPPQDPEEAAYHLEQGNPGAAGTIGTQTPSTYTQGVASPNVAPPVGGGGGTGVPPPMLADPNNPLNNPAFGTGEMLTDPNAGGQRMQDFMGVAGPAAGLAGAALGAAGNAQGRPPASGGFPARGGGWNMPSHLTTAAQFNRR